MNAARVVVINNQEDLDRYLGARLSIGSDSPAVRAVVDRIVASARVALTKVLEAEQAKKANEGAIQ